MKLSLIIPVYNESRRINQGLKLALAYLKQQDYSWEIIVVDDGSTDDGTSKINHQQVRILRTGKNFGKGHAIRLGVEAAVGDYIVFSDIDFSVSITYLPQFLSAPNKFDVAIGSRRLPNSRIVQHQSLLREFLGRGFTAMSNFILGLDHTDLTCGFKGFKNQVAKNLFSHQQLNRWAFDSEILFLAKKLGYIVAEIPVSWHNHPLTKVNLAKDIANSFWSLIYTRCSHL